MSLKMKLDRYLTPFSLTMPFGITVALSHWLMLAIIGVCIYADNFVRRENTTITNPRGSATGQKYFHQNQKQATTRARLTQDI